VLALWDQAVHRDAGAHVFVRRDLAWSWLETMGRALGVEPCVAFAVDGEGRRAVLPAIVSPQRGRLLTRRLLEPVGQDLFGYAAPASEAGDAGVDWDGFWEAVRATHGRHDQAIWRGVPRLRAGCRFAGPPGDACPVLELRGAATLDDLLRFTSPNHRGDVRRRLRRLAEQGEVSLQVAGAADTTGALDEVRARMWPAWASAMATRGWALYRRPGLRAFCERVVAEGLSAGYAAFAVLRVAGASVAWHLGFQHAGRLYWWLPAHEPRWEPYSPGKVLLARLLEHLARAGWAEVHFQSGAQPYKMAWRPGLADIAALRWYAPGARRTVLAAYDAFSRARHGQ
jgi:CelD/BcsL family acetyltransferase involved in cellulose biosynthesis